MENKSNSRFLNLKNYFTEKSLPFVLWIHTSNCQKYRNMKQNCSSRLPQVGISSWNYRERLWKKSFNNFRSLGCNYNCVIIVKQLHRECHEHTYFHWKITGYRFSTSLRAWTSDRQDDHTMLKSSMDNWMSNSSYSRGKS